MSTGLRLVCFDLGGVVLRICHSWAEACHAAGLPDRDPDAWTRTALAHHALLVEHQTGRIDASVFAERASAIVEGLYSPAEILAVHHSWMLGAYDGIPELLDALHEAGLDTAALSNTSHEHWRRINEFEVVGRFRHLLASHLLGLHKPDPAIYRRVEQQTGFGGTEVLFFDDLPQNVEGARSVGWHAERIDPNGCTATQCTEVLRGHGVGV